ncbi:hypothetical protein AMECASPLE_004154 [Ameca splendens]|uniref:Ig-like domain-containing protein n=1 Tax=Ameca splendens TaxID=208324 RepID=A0ABV0ZW47_9TELE
MQPFPALQENKMFKLCGLVALLCLHQGMFCIAFYVSQMQVDYGQPAVLRCDGSVLKEAEGAVHWELRGEDVVTLREGEPRVSERFKGRIQLPSEEQIEEGNWSVVLRKTKFRDADMYECIWQEVKSISTIWLSVKEPNVNQSITALDDANVDLTCFIKPQREPLRSLFWTRNGKHLYSHDLTSSAAMEGEFLLSSRFNKEEFHLYLRPTVNDSGKYQCWYTTGESDPPKLGIPESYTLTVMKRVISDVMVLEETSADDWMSPVTFWEEEAIAAETTETPTDGLAVYLELSTEAMKVMEHDETSTVEEQIRTSHEVVTLLSDDVNGVEATGFPTEFLPILLEESTQLTQDEWNLLSKDLTNSKQTDDFKEKETFSDNENLDPTWNDFQLETFPWIRAGLIGGVLLITAVVLCVLGALRHI